MDIKKHNPKLKGVFGNETAELVLLHIHLLGETWAQCVADDYGVALTPIKKQLERFAAYKILKKVLKGRMVIYTFDPSCKQTRHIQALIADIAEPLTMHQRTIFEQRRRMAGYESPSK